MSLLLLFSCCCVIIGLSMMCLRFYFGLRDPVVALCLLVFSKLLCVVHLWLCYHCSLFYYSCYHISASAIHNATNLPPLIITPP